ncbi:MAG TPA: molybdopterin converting factor subunit 1 [Candidatus Acidoferrales bacterium]|nr:molybdopterin converting factor subunit 1 [Candidatus Acidoferrales bacterium]
MNEGPTLRTRVIYFAQARERAGTAGEPLELPAGSRVRDALRALAAKHPALAPLEGTLAVAVDGTLARADDALQDGAELALLPPVSGG